MRLRSRECTASHKQGAVTAQSPSSSAAATARFSTACVLWRDGITMVRLYRPRAEILNGKWKFPEAQPVN